MNEDLFKLLNVENEIDVLKSVNRILEESEAKDATIAELENKIKDFEVAEKQKHAEAITEFLNDAVKAGKIKEENKEKWFAMAETDFDTVKETINAIEIVKPGGVKDFIEDPDPETAKLTAVEKWEKNYKAGVYEKDKETAKRDFKAAFGIELT